MYRLRALVLVLATTVPLAAAADKKGDGEVDVKKAFLDKPAGAVLDHFKLRADDLSMIDEPPGKLQAFSFVRKSDDKRIYVWLDYTPKLFSAERKWDLNVIRATKVRKVTFKPV